MLSQHLLRWLFGRYPKTMIVVEDVGKGFAGDRFDWEDILGTW